jgi:CubicO group peptidase (beta-lactamase class C family)
LKKEKIVSTRYKLIVALMIILILVAGCRGGESTPTSSSPEQTALEPAEQWQYSTPIDQGMSAKALDEFFGVVSSYADSVLVIRNGYIVLEQNSSNFPIESKHFLFSTTKSVLSILIGIAIDTGHIEGVDQRVLDFFPERTVRNLDERKEALTLKHLLTMSSGLDCPENETISQLTSSWDWDQFALDLPMSGNPGDAYHYCNANSHLLSSILSEATGMSALDFAHEHLFGPLGIKDVQWDSDNSNRDKSRGFSGLWMSPHDLAKLGQLYLQGGVWEGEQIVSSSWVEESTQAHTSCEDHGYRNGYGYQWWIGSDSDSWYMTSGSQGQHLFVLPEQEIVVVFVGSYEQANNNLYERHIRNYLIPALDTPSLEEQVAELAAVEPEPVPPLPEIARRVSGQTYILGPHTYLFEEFSLTFPEGASEATFSFRRYGIDYEFLIGLDNVWRVNTAMGPKLPQYRAMRGSWSGEDTFVMEQIDLDEEESWECISTFQDDEVSFRFQFQSGTSPFHFETRGRLQE